MQAQRRRLRRGKMCGVGPLRVSLSRGAVVSGFGKASICLVPPRSRSLLRFFGAATASCSERVGFSSPRPLAFFPTESSGSAVCSASSPPEDLDFRALCAPPVRHPRTATSESSTVPSGYGLPQKPENPGRPWRSQPRGRKFLWLFRLPSREPENPWTGWAAELGRQKPTVVGR